MLITKVYSGISIKVDDDDLKKSNVVYRFTFPNGKTYIGLTALLLKTRLIAHCHETTKPNSKRTSIYKNRALLKYKEIVVDVLYQGEDLSEMEMHFIKIYKSNNPSTGYNSSAGGERNTPSDETIAKIRKSVIANNEAKGITYRGNVMYRGKKVNRPSRAMYTDEERKARQCSWFKGVSPTNKGKPILPHVQEAMLSAIRGKPAWNRGIPATDEQKANMSRIKSGCNPKGRFNIQCFDVDGNLEATFTKFSEAEKYVNGHERFIRECCRGLKQAYRGRTFKFA